MILKDSLSDVLIYNTQTDVIFMFLRKVIYNFDYKNALHTNKTLYSPSKPKNQTQPLLKRNHTIHSQKSNFVTKYNNQYINTNIHTRFMPRTQKGGLTPQHYINKLILIKMSAM